MASSQNPIQTYYRPYLPSDSETSDADTDLSYESPPQSPRPDNAGPDLEGIPDFSALALGLKGPSQQAAGPTFKNLSENDAYAINRIGNNVYGSYPLAVSSGEPVKMQSTDVPTVIILQSLDRDKRLFPQPTDCRLMLPRPYQNVGGFSIAQINLTSAFFYFNTGKQNTSIQIYEKDRIIYNPNIPTTALLDSAGNVVPLKPINTIRDGSYDVNGLMSELTLQLNRTPLFYDFINGFSDFLTTFPISGDLSLNFNEPGDTYFDSMSDTYIPNPTREVICSHYFQSRYVLQTTFTVVQMLIAYYYPVLKEILLDYDTKVSPDTSSLTWNGLTLNLAYIDPATNTQLDVYNYVIHNFTGLEDPVVESFINIAENVVVFDNYRLNHTFRYSLVNQYTCTSDPTNNRITIKSDGLNTSLSNYLNSKYNSILTQQISANGLTLEQYNNLANIVIVNRAIYQEMYTMLQNMFTAYFAVDYGTYTADYFVNSNNTLVLRPGIDAYGVGYSYNPNIIPRSNDIMLNYKVKPPSYWPYMTSMAGRQGAQTNMGTTIDTFPVSSNFPYNLSQSNIDLTRNFVDSNGYIYTDYRRKCGDILVNVEANKYTIFKFRSQYRQSLQVETLPRQTNFRYPIWNKNPANRASYPIQTLFDVSYCYIAPDQRTPQGSNMFNRDISFNAVYGWSNDPFGNPSQNFGVGFATSASYWGPYQEQINIANSNGRIYAIRSPYKNNAPDSQTHKFSLNITFTSSNPFPIDYFAFLYHDIAALAADVSDVGRLKENPNNYKQKVVIAAGTLSNTIHIGAYQNQTYYTLFRPSIQSPPATFYTVVPWMPNSYFSTLVTTDTISNLVDPVKQLSNYYAAIEADPDFIRLPIQSTLWASNSPANTFLNLNLSSFITPIGYDAKGVSTDLTDYVPFAPFNQFSTINPNAKYCVDPLTNYVFQYNTPYDKISKSYFGLDTGNAIFTEAALSNYKPSTVSVRQYKIAQYYNTTYIHDTGDITYSEDSVNKNFPPYNLSTTNGVALGGYPYSPDETLGNPLQLGQGVIGYTFLPNDGTWAIDRMTFKTSFTVPNDPGNTNADTHLLAVFYTSEIFTVPINYARLSNALGIYLRTSERTYTDGATNLGFDSGFGTYYTFTNFPNLVSRSNAIISGFTQNPGKLITDLSSYYSIVAFTLPDYTGNWTYKTPAMVTKDNLITASVTTMQNLVGTPIPYPYGCAVSTSSVFYDGLTAPTGFDMVVASAPFPSTIYGPRVNYGEPVQSVSQYEQSVPFVNSHLHYKSQENIIVNSNGISPWVVDFEPPYNMCASVVERTIQSDAYSLWTTGYAAFQRDIIIIATYRIYKSIDVLTDPERNFVFDSQLAVEEIFPTGENTHLVAMSGNTSNFVFLGLTDNNSFRFRTYDPVTRTMRNLQDVVNYVMPNNCELQNFVVNSSNGWYFSGKIANTNTVVVGGTPSYTRAGIDTNFRSFTYNGSYTELHMPVGGRNLYFAYYNSNGFSNYHMFPLDPTNPNNFILSRTGFTINLDTSPLGTMPYYTQMLVTLNNSTEEILLTNTNYVANSYYKIRTYLRGSNVNMSNSIVDTSAQLTVDPSNNIVAPTRIYGGVNGSKWFIADTYPYFYGNRNDVYDAPTSLGIAWQIFFPNIKIEMRKTGNNSTPMIDLTKLTYPEWPHTCMFSYSNYDSMVMDISQNWGLEKNFMTSDTTFSGFYFNSYMLNVPLQDKSTASLDDSNAFTYVAVRGYLPTESFQCLMRFNLPNRYDFGFITITDLINEISLVQTKPFEFNPTYADTITQFNSNFVFSNMIFGASSTQGLPGSNIASTSFGDFMNTYVGIYSNFSTNSVILQKIQASLADDINSYISTNLKYILPPSALIRTRFTDPILFNILWESHLTPSYSVLDDKWGLGWNLGFSKKDTIMSTYQVAQSFYKIQEDYIYLKLNPEFNMNGMDAGSKEDYKTTRESTGSTKQYYCKLLLTGFGGNATTFIHNPITFNPPLNRITNLQFQWIDMNGLVINNADSDWNMTVTMTEKYEIPVLPEKMPFTTMSESDMKAADFGSTAPPPSLVAKEEK
jgi:hypothetical protein